MAKKYFFVPVLLALAMFFIPLSKTNAGIIPPIDPPPGDEEPDEPVGGSEYLAKSQYNQQNDIMAMDYGQTLDGYPPNQSFNEPITDFTPARLKIILKKSPESTCEDFHVGLYDSVNEAVESNEWITLTDEFQEYTLTFPALDEISYPGRVMDLYKIELKTMINSGYCQYFIKGSDMELDGQRFNNSAFNFSMYYELYGIDFNAPDDNEKLYSLNIVYPQPDGNYPYFTLWNENGETSHYSFKLHYSISNNYFRDKRHIVALVSLNPDFSDPHAQFDELISENDPDNKRTLTVPDILANNDVPTYYIFGIMDYNNPRYPDGHMIVGLSIAINASSTLTNLQKSDWGFFGNLARDIFLPTADTKQKLIDLKDNLMGKWLFGYIQDNLNTIHDSYEAVANDNSKPDIVYSFALHGTEDSPTDFNFGEMKVLDTSLPEVKSFSQQLRPYIIAILWFLFFLYIFWRVFYFDHL